MSLLFHLEEGIGDLVQKQQLGCYFAELILFDLWRRKMRETKGMSMKAAECKRIDVGGWSYTPQSCLYDQPSS
jgi:hypothetical protein